MASDDELELLLAFQSVPETPPSSPSRFETPSSDSKGTTPPFVRAALSEVFGYGSDDDDDNRNKNASMEVFRTVVKLPPKTAPQRHHAHNDHVTLPNTRPRPLETANHTEIEVHSRLRIRNRSVSHTSLSNRLLDLRFVPLQAIKIATMGENIMGAWATIGVLAEKGTPRVSSTGQNFAIWKIASLDSALIAVFLFGEAFTHHYKEPAGCIFAVFNAKVRRDDKRKELSLSIVASDQLMKLGTSVDYCVCKGKRKDGTPCTAVVNRQQGEYCQYHSSAMRQKYKSKRAELGGGNLATGLTFLQKPGGPQGARGFSRCSDEIPSAKSEKPVKIMSLKGLKNVLSNADKVTTKFQSQGIRFLSRLADESKENVNPKSSLKNQNKSKHGALPCKTKLKDSESGPLQKRVKSDECKNGSSPKQLAKTKSKDSAAQYHLIELDLEEQDNPDDDAMAQAMKLFGKDGLLH